MRASQFTEWAAGKLSKATKGEDRKWVLETLKNDPTPLIQRVVFILPVFSVEFYLDDQNEEVVIKDQQGCAQEIVGHLKELLKDEIAALT